ncbi:GNAT family N-acetyltransferase [Sphingomonas immobilis]|nr:GNAT family N-acetyltransferase [Sphingomonas sp. CA1-15]
MAGIKITDNRFEQEFVAETEGRRAVAAYQLDDGVMTFTHTLVPKALEGQGIGTRLVRFALDAARDEGLKVRPMCAFVRAYIERHPEYRDLVVR